MIPVKNMERAIRSIEAMNALSVVLPLYDPELRAAFRAAFNIDMYHLLPKFFQDMARVGIQHEDEFMQYLEYVEQLIEYIRNPAATLPIPEDAENAAFVQVRAEAEMYVKSWRIVEVKDELASA